MDQLQYWTRAGQRTSKDGKSWRTEENQQILRMYKEVIAKTINNAITYCREHKREKAGPDGASSREKQKALLQRSDTVGKSTWPSISVIPAG